jgi:hypothetical protein
VCPKQTENEMSYLLPKCPTTEDPYQDNDHSGYDRYRYTQLYTRATVNVLRHCCCLGIQIHLTAVRLENPRTLYILSREPVYRGLFFCVLWSPIPPPFSPPPTWPHPDHTRQLDGTPPRTPSLLSPNPRPLLTRRTRTGRSP